MHRLLPSSLSTSPRTENIPDNVTVTCPQSLAHKRLPNPSSYLLKRLFFFLGFLFQRTLGTFCVLPLTTQIFSQLFQFLFQCSTLTTNKNVQYKTGLFKERSNILNFQKNSKFWFKFTIVVLTFLLFHKDLSLKQYAIDQNHYISTQKIYIKERLARILDCLNKQSIICTMKKEVSV